MFGFGYGRWQESVAGTASVRSGCFRGNLEIEHIRPAARGGGDEEENLWLCCSSCNSFKGTQTHAHDPVTNRRVPLFNPRRQKWARHFKWSPDGTQIIGMTVTGRAAVVALKLNNMFSVTARREWALAVSPPKRSN